MKRMQILALAAVVALAARAPAKGSTAPEAAVQTAGSPTVVAATLRQAMPEGKNVLWCATLQVAWDELAAKLGDPLAMQNAPPEVAALNEHLVGKADVTPGSYVAFAGPMTAKNQQNLLRQIAARFGGEAQPDLLKSLRPESGLFLYTYLLRSLPFAVHFQRSALPFDFQGTPVDSWNCDPLKAEPHEASQITVADYRSDDDFVLTFETTSPEDELILAKVKPGATLYDTVESVVARLKRGGDHPEDGEMLVVPVLSFEADQSFAQLCHHALLGKDGAPSALFFQQVDQTIRFRLDETGGWVESEVMGGVLGVEEPKPLRSFVFDKPFLVLIQRTGSRRPYVALWIANAELMTPSTGPRVIVHPGEPTTMNGQAAMVRAEFQPQPPVQLIQPAAALRPLKLLSKVEPIYPPLALRMRKSGRVVAELVVNEKGEVEAARVVRSTDLLFNDAALRAVRQYRYSPPVDEKGAGANVFQEVTLVFDCCPK